MSESIPLVMRYVNTNVLICSWVYMCIIQCVSNKMVHSENNVYVTRSRKMSHLSNISISIFLHRFHNTYKCCNVMQTPSQLDMWLQSYEGFDNAKTIWNKGIWTLFLPISQKQHLRHPTHSWSCHIYVNTGSLMLSFCFSNIQTILSDY